jgi:hypothetical protein
MNHNATNFCKTFSTFTIFSLLLGPTPLPAQVLEFSPGQKAFPAAEIVFASPSDEKKAVPIAYEAPYGPLGEGSEFTLMPVEESLPAIEHQFYISKALRSRESATACLYRSLTEYSREHRIAANTLKQIELPHLVSPKKSVKEPLADVAGIYRPFIELYQRTLDSLYQLPSMGEFDREFLVSNLPPDALLKINLDNTQEARQLARLLYIDGRLALAEGRIEDAIKAARTLFHLYRTRRLPTC